MEEGSLFADFDTDGMLFHPPLGGMSDRMVSGIRWTNRSMRKIGQPSTEGRSGGVTEIKSATTSLKKVSSRTERPMSEYLASEKIDGVWRTGMSKLDHGALVEILHEQGYKRADKEELEDF